jgi:FKBP-type peptidyl-prolyl cis-trans isomerase FklB
MKKSLNILLMSLLCLLTAGTVVSCSESEDEEANEFYNWKERNDAFWLTLEDSLSRGGTAWRKIKSFTKDPTTAGANTDYIYVRVLETGEEMGSPLYTDTVRVSYRGRLIPTQPYHLDGYVFDQTYRDDFDWLTAGVTNAVTSSFVDGFTTALMYMHIGDCWRVYIPYQLGYRSTAKNSIPAYSTLIFDMALVDYWQPRTVKQPFAARGK